MTRRILLSLAASAALLGAHVNALAQAPSLAGSVYRNANTGNYANAVAGAYVYVHRADASGDTWTGPALTDRYGRFVFPSLDRGPYLLRVFVGSRRVWQQTVTVPATLSPIVVPIGT
jgi:hypothetical protein